MKSVILNVLLGERVNDAALLQDSGCYADVPTTLRTAMNRLSEYVRPRPQLPSIMDPSGTGENFGDRWNQEGYAAFRTAVMRYAEWIEDAWSEPNPTLSLQKWQRVFGDGFQPPKLKSATALVKASSTALVPFTNTEQHLSDLRIPDQSSPRYQVRIQGRVMRKHGFREYVLSGSGSKVRIGCNLEFSIVRCTVPAPYEVLWKVKNNGEESRQRDCIRGQIQQRSGSHSITEPTAFTGPHYVECYIIKGGICLAKDRQDVTII